MNELCDEVILKIFNESGFLTAKLNNFKIVIDKHTSIFVSKRQGSNDYFIYMFLQSEFLSLVNDEIQINLISKIKDDINEFQWLTDKMEIESSFDKNVTLIIFTNGERHNLDKVLRNAIAIEEDPYFFKKHVFLLSSSEEQVLMQVFSEHKKDFLTYLKDTISNIDLFNKFSKNQDDTQGLTYRIATKFYEKLPFLKLDMQRAEQQDLSQNIESQLSDNDMDYRDQILALNGDEINKWIENIASSHPLTTTS